MLGFCPDQSTLRALLLGQLRDPESERWETHLEHCSTCVRAAGTLSTCDPLTREARQAAAGPSPLVISPDELPIVRGLMERARSLYGSVGPERGAALPPEGLPFLEAPRGEGEIGRLGAYRVLRLLGAGGMGLVFLAEDERLRRSVALKVLHPRLAEKPEARTRFLREARAMAAIAHENIVSVHHVEETGTTPFLVMPLLSGLPLSTWLTQHPRPPLATVLRWGRQIASGLAAAHEHGLIHRDVKPSNLWVETPGERIKILDFGLAYFDREDVHLTASGMIVGTPAYMAPEQARGRTPDPRADLFSLGCVLYELCTGEKPFRGDTVMAILSALANDEPAPVRSLNPSLPIGVEVLVCRLLAKQPAQRPASAREVADTLGQLEAVPPVPVRPRRRRWLVAAAAALAVVSAASVTWWSRREPNPRPVTTEVRQEHEAAKKSEPTPQLPTVDPQPHSPDRLAGHTDTVTALAFPAGGKTLASASADSTVRLWTLATGAPKTLIKFPAPCTAMTLAPDGHMLASGDRDGSVRIDDLETGQVLQTFNEPKGVAGLAFGRNNLLYVATRESVVFWGWLTHTRSDHFFAQDRVTRTVAMDPRGELVVAGTQDGDLYIRTFNPPGNRQILNLRKEPLCGAVFSPNGDTLATVGEPPDETVRLWDMKSLRTQGRFAPSRNLTLHRKGATCVAWSPEGRIVASGGLDGVVLLWDPDTGAVRAEFRHHDPGAERAGVTCLAFSPDGRLLASGGADKVIRLHEASAFSGPPKR